MDGSLCATEPHFISATKQQHSTEVAFNARHRPRSSAGKLLVVPQAPSPKGGAGGGGVHMLGPGSTGGRIQTDARTLRPPATDLSATRGNKSDADESKAPKTARAPSRAHPYDCAQRMCPCRSGAIFERHGVARAQASAENRCWPNLPLHEQLKDIFVAFFRRHVHRGDAIRRLFGDVTDSKKHLHSSGQPNPFGVSQGPDRRTCRT